MSITVRAPARNPNPQPGNSDPVAGADALPAPSAQAMQDALDKEEMLQRFIQWWKGSRDHFQPFKQEAAQAYDFVAGWQWRDDDIQVLRDQNRPAITYNRIASFVDGVSGLEMGNRQTTQYLPRQVGNSAVNELLTSAAEWVRQECGADFQESEAVRDVIICGVGCTQTRLDYDEDPDGMIVIERIDPLEMYMDPSSRQANFTDARFVMRVKDVPVSVAEEMFPDYPTVDLHAQWAEDELDSVEQPHNARLAPYYRIDQADNIDKQTQQIRLVEVEWWDYVTAYRALDQQSGRFIRLSEEEAEQLRMRMMMLGAPEPMMVKDRQKRYYKAIVGNIVLRVLKGPDEGGFTYKFMTGKRDRNRGYWYGLVRAMIDPQMWANKFLTQALHIVNVNAKGGLLAETDAFVDVEEARDSWAEADSIVELNPGGLGKVQQKEVPAFPVQINQMMEQAIAAIPATAGVNLEMIAQQTADQPGVLEMQRKQQGMTVLAYIFNAKRKYQQEQGKLMLWLITHFLSDGRLIRIGGPEEAQYVPLVHQPGLSEYDVIVDDAPSSPNMKERVWTMVMQLMPMLRSLPMPALLPLFKYSPLPTTVVQDVEQALQQQSQQPPSPEIQGKVALEQAKAQHYQAASQKLQAEAQTLPMQMATEAQERSARIESLRANAAAALAKAGVSADDLRFQQLLDAVNALVDMQGNVHKQALDAQAQGHDQMMDRAGHALDVYQAMNPPQPAGPQAGAAA